VSGGESLLCFEVVASGLVVAVAEDPFSREREKVPAGG
jgi:hypothetical protein